MGAMAKTFLATILLALSSWFAPCSAADGVWPSRSWESVDPSTIGWSLEKLAAAEAFAGSYSPTAVVVVQDGKIVAAWGETSRKANVRSVRKSLLSALYGIAVGDGKLSLDRTLGDVGIDDREPRLTETEKQATIRDLLMARSGIYHAAAYETPDMAMRRPARGSHLPGSFWYYNNWDFNALGSIYERIVGKSVFQGFEERIAGPIGMEDFNAADGRFVFEPFSDHPAYPMRLTARDLARFGWLFLNRGSWAGAQIIPADWVDESTRAWSEGDYGHGYGYMWWTVPAEMVHRHRSLTGAYMALGYGGQGLGVVPLLRLVVAQVTDVREGREWIRGGTFQRLLVLIAAAARSPD